MSTKQKVIGRVDERVRMTSYGVGSNDSCELSFADGSGRWYGTAGVSTLSVAGDASLSSSLCLFVRVFVCGLC